MALPCAGTSAPSCSTTRLRPCWRSSAPAALGWTRTCWATARRRLHCDWQHTPEMMPVCCTCQPSCPTRQGDKRDLVPGPCANQPPHKPRFAPAMMNRPEFALRARGEQYIQKPMHVCKKPCTMYVYPSPSSPKEGDIPRELGPGPSHSSTWPHTAYHLSDWLSGGSLLLRG